MKSTTRWFYLYSLFASMDLTRGVFLIFFTDKGISNTEIGVLQTTLFLSGVLIELPAGIGADLTKRKYSVILGMLLIAFSSTLFLSAESFSLLLILFALQGAGLALCSGADHALLYDNIRSKLGSSENTYLKVSSRARNIATISLTVSILAGGWLSRTYGWSAIYIPTSIFMLLAAIAIFRVPELAPSNGAHGPSLTLRERISEIHSHLKSFRASGTSFQFLAFVVGMAFIEATHTPFFMYMQIYLKDRGLNEFGIGAVIALSMMSSSVAYLFVGKLSNVRLSQLVLISSLVLASAVLVFALPLPITVGVFLFCIVNAIPSLLFVFTDNFANNLLPESVRATLLSMKALLTSLMICLSYLVMGALMDRFTPQGALWCLGVLPLAGLLIILYSLRRNSEARQVSHSPSDTEQEAAV